MPDTSHEGVALPRDKSGGSQTEHSGEGGPNRHSTPESPHAGLVERNVIARSVIVGLPACRAVGVILSQGEPLAAEGVRFPSHPFIVSWRSSRVLSKATTRGAHDATSGGAEP